MSSFKLGLALLMVSGLAAGAFAAGANTPWGDATRIKVGVVVQTGDTNSAWEGVGRNDMTGNSTSFFTPTNEMTAVGDGTYQIRVDLIPGAVYNYIFRAKLARNIAGFTTGQEFTEPIPNGTQTDDGNNTATTDPGYFLSTSSVAYTDPGSGAVTFISIGDDARRRILMPDIAPTTTVYVFNNFGSIPRGVANYTVVPGSNFVDLWWQGGLGTWGGTSASPDTFGGGYGLYVSTGFSGGTYSPVTTLTGQTTYYRHTGLSAGTSYFYIFVSSDAYNGVTRSSYTAVKAIWANLARAVPPSTTFDTSAYNHNDKSGKPNTPAPVYFKVENIDLEYVEKNGNIVWLTPVEEDGRFYTNKIPGTLLTVYIPRQGS